MRKSIENRFLKLIGSLAGSRATIERQVVMECVKKAVQTSGFLVVPIASNIQKNGDSIHGLVFRLTVEWKILATIL